MTTHASANEGDLRPDGLPEQFNTVGDLAASYTELRAKMDSGSSEAPEALGDPTGVGSPTAPPEGTTELTGTSQLALGNAVPPPVATPTLTAERLTEISAAYMSSGELDAASRAELDAAYGAATVDQHLAGYAAQSELHVSKVLGAAGGEDSYAQLANWVTNNVTEAERLAYDAAVDSRDTGSALLAVEGMKARMAASVGVAPASTVGGSRAPVGSQGFANTAEQYAMQQDPKYHLDNAIGEAFRAEFMRRLEATGELA